MSCMHSIATSTQVTMEEGVSTAATHPANFGTAFLELWFFKSIRTGLCKLARQNSAAKFADSNRQATVQVLKSWPGFVVSRNVDV